MCQYSNECKNVQSKCNKTIFPLTDCFERLTKNTDKYKQCNHHHEISKDHEVVDFGDGEFIANKAAIPLLKALNEIGLRTRTHHYDGGEHGFVSILLDESVVIEFKTVNEIHADRIKYNGQKEMLISWQKAKDVEGV